MCPRKVSADRGSGVTWGVSPRKVSADKGSRGEAEGGYGSVRPAPPGTGRLRQCPETLSCPETKRITKITFGSSIV